MALEGSLRDMPLADLFEIVHADRRSGRLQVRRGEEHGLIFVGAGQLLDAVLVTDLEGAHVAYAEDAVLRILSWPEADFTFEHDPLVSVRPRRIIRDIDWVLATATKPTAASISLDSRLCPAKPGADAVGPFMLSVAEWRLLGALWPQRTLGMARAELELAAHEVLVLARSLLERGLLAIHGNGDQPAAPPQVLKPAQPEMPAAPPGPSARQRPAAPAAPAPQSHLLKAIIRRIRSL